MAEVYIATTDAVVNHDGEFVRVRRNITRVAEGHPLLKQHPEFFKPATDDVHFGVRTARDEPVVPSRDEDKTEAEPEAEAEAKPEPEAEAVPAQEAEAEAEEPEVEAPKPQRRGRRS